MKDQISRPLRKGKPACCASSGSLNGSTVLRRDIKKRRSAISRGGRTLIPVSHFVSFQNEPLLSESPRWLLLYPHTHASQVTHAPMRSGRTNSRISGVVVPGLSALPLPEERGVSSIRPSAKQDARAMQAEAKSITAKNQPSPRSATIR